MSSHLGSPQWSLSSKCSLQVHSLPCVFHTLPIKSSLTWSCEKYKLWRSSLSNFFQLLIFHSFRSIYFEHPVSRFLALYQKPSLTLHFEMFVITILSPYEETKLHRRTTTEPPGRVGRTPVSHVTGLRSSRPVTLRLLGYSSVPPGKCRDRASI